MNRSVRRFVPKLFDCLRPYGRDALVSDLIAGLTVGLVALPLAMAFAISSGVKPEAGIYTAIVAGLVVSALGGSRCQIAGPTGAFVVIVAGIAAKFGVAGLLMCTAMAGLILMAIALCGLGTAVRYIPRPVTIGFTNGIAVLIASTQIKDFFGLRMAEVPGEFVPRLESLARNFNSASMTALGLAATALGILIFWPRVTRRVPGSIVALFVTTGASLAFGLDAETIGSRFGGVPSGLPSIGLPEFHADMILPLLPSALTVALLAAIESLLSAVVADNLSGDKHKPDAELLAQGLANLVTPLFGGIPATGAIARTAANIRSGAKTPVSGIVHAITLLAIVLVAAPLARHIPLAALAAILVMVAYNMGEWRQIGPILKLSKADRAVWGATFALTVLADLTVAVEVGMVLAALLYILRVSKTTSVVPVTEHYLRDNWQHVLQGKSIPPYVTILRIHGPFLFGTTDKLEDAAERLDTFGPVVALRLRNMTALDSTGLHAIESFARQLRKAGKSLVICGARRQPEKLIRRSELPELIGRENILPHVEAALQRAREIHEARPDDGRPPHRKAA